MEREWKPSSKKSLEWFNMRPGVPDVHITDSRDAELAEYRALAGQSVLGLICGLASPLALVDPALWSIPAAGTLLSWWALRRIKNHTPAMTGRKMAILGLSLSLLFLAAAPTDLVVHRALVRAEAGKFAALWFKYLAQEEPHKAHQLTLAPRIRKSLDDRLKAFYRDNPQSREALENYTQLPVVRTLLTLGPRAQVRLHQTVGQGRDGDKDWVEQLYTVTYEEGNERKTFFVDMRMMRETLPEGAAEWRMLQTDGDVRPEGEGTSDQASSP